MPRVSLQVILAISVVLALGYYLSGGSVPGPEVSAWQKALPKTYLINTRITTYNTEGALTNVLQADSATFYPSQKQSLMNSPRLDSHDLDDETWTASSDVGLFNHRQEVLTLTENVKLSNEANQGQLETERMRIDLRTNTATSRVPVLFTRGASTIRADGMVANLDSQTLRLKSNVETVYVQPTP